MATLVLSTVGNALGGPVGSAVGALIGQSIDQELLAPNRRGPRVGDLAVQTSSYGTQIPRIYGRMRVAGTVIWSTNLIEGSLVDGAKGQPDVTYSYSVSLAVALSSRRVASLGRIWADGQLLRGAAGDFKVDTQFRFYDGGDDQIVDPLIASAEGISNTPAYRGLAIAVFENLQLAAFGNRIPVLTFEVVAEAAPVPIAAILGDATDGAVLCGASNTIRGFAAYGRSRRSAVEPLVDCFDLDLFDDGSVIRSPAAGSPLILGSEDYGNSSDGKAVPRLERVRSPATAMPAVLRLAFYDPDRDFQSGEMRAVAEESQGGEVQHDLPAVLSASEAKLIAHRMIARAWAERETITVRLPPGKIALEPGMTVDLGDDQSLWRVHQATIDGFVVVAELRPAITQATAMTADGGRALANDDVVNSPLTLALFDVPNVFEEGSNAPTILLAASAASGWQRRSIELSFAGQTITVEPAIGKSVLGQALTILGPADGALIDEFNSVDIELVDTNQELANCDDDGLAAARNLAVLGSEMIQFGRAESLGPGRFRLSRLLRGRGGTEWACSSHSTADRFCLLQPGTVQPITLPSWSVGAGVAASAYGVAGVDAPFAGESVRPLCPVNLSANSLPDGSVELSWTRRSRRGFAWIDGIDAPLGEALERYRVGLTGDLGSLEIEVVEPAAHLTMDQLAGLGAGPLSIAVVQIGDVATSRPAHFTVNIS